MSLGEGFRMIWRSMKAIAAVRFTTEIERKDFQNE